MKNYLLQFKSSAFNGSLTLFGRILLPNILISIITSIFAAVLVLPLIAKGLGMSMMDMQGKNQALFKNIMESIKDGESPASAFVSNLGEPNVLLIFTGAIISIIIGCWHLYLLFKLNDSEVRTGDNGTLSALKNSFSSKIFSLLGLVFIMYLLIVVGFALSVILVIFIIKGLGVIGGIIGFFLFLFLVALTLRFSIAPAAMIHGNMSISDSIGYSWHNITLRRSFLLLLISIVFMIISVIATGLLTMLVYLIVPKGDNMFLFITSRVISGAIAAVFSAYMYAAISAIYFKFSTDDDGEIQEEEIQEHLIN